MFKNEQKIKQVIIAGASTFYVKNLGDDAAFEFSSKHKKL